MTKPFDKAELLARVQAVIRRSKGFSQTKLEIGTVQLDLDSRQVTVNKREVPVRPGRSRRSWSS